MRCFYPAYNCAVSRTYLLLILGVIACATPSFAASSGCDGAGNCYIRAGASGSGSGADWTNAYTGFGSGAGQVDPSAMSRGVTYWIAAGAYGARTFSTPDSGSTVITIEGATTSSHGPASDWSDSFAGQATFIGNNAVTTDYWTFNGQAEPGCSYPHGTGDSGDSCYSIHFWNKSNAGGAAVSLASSSTTGETFEYVEMEGTGQGFPSNTSTSDRCSSNNCGGWSDNGIYTGAYGTTNLYVGYSYIHHTGNTQFQMNGASSNNVTWEYNWVSYNHTGQNGQHDEAYSLYASNVTIRNNVFQDISGSGLITTAGAGLPSLSNWAVYGNLFFWDPTYAAYNGQYSLATIDNAVLDFLGEKMSGYVYFYNNTMAGFNNSVVTGSGTAFSTMAISGLSGDSVCGSSCPTVQIYNNLWWNSAYVTGDFSSYCSVVTGANCTQDYDAVYNGSVPAGSLGAPNEPHGYVVTSSANPFANSAASTIAGYEPVTPDPFASHAGTSLGSPYNVDMLGVTRGANGTWDRGALQLNSANLGTLQSIAVTPANPSIIANNTEQFIATGTYSNGTTANLTSSVTWTSGATGVASISNAGLGTGLEAGTSTITATSGSVTGSTTLTVTSATLKSISVTPANASIATGGTEQYAVTGTYSNGTTQNITSSITWSSSNTSVATISASGLAKGAAAGTTTIAATSGSVTSSTGLTVTAATLKSIAVTPANASIATGGTEQYTATGSYSNGTTQNITSSVTWSSSNTSAATVSSGGLAKAVAAGSTTITAISGSVSGSTGLTIAAPTLQSIAVTPANASVTTGTTEPFTATGTYSNGTTQNLTSSVTWSSGNLAVATITGGGLAATLAPGTATITAIYGSVSGSTTLTVTLPTSTNPRLVSISLRPASVHLHKGNIQALKAVGQYSDGSTKNLTGSVTWASSNPSIAAVSSSGVVSAIGRGTATITATSGSITGSAQVTVGSRQ